MPKHNVQMEEEEIFGARMARLRKAAGYSQRDLARETGITQRMIAYYEKQSQYPPTHVIPALSAALGVSTEELLGLKKAKSDGKIKDMRIRRRLNKIEQLDEKEKRQVIQLLDTFIEKDSLKKKVMSTPKQSHQEKYTLKST